MDVHFKFKVKQWIKTPFGEMGYIEMCAIDESPYKKYYVQSKETARWFNEDDLALPTGSDLDSIPRQMAGN